MRGSVKANLIVFFIIAIIAFCISSAFATLTIHEEDIDSYKLVPVEDDSFEPEEIYYVPTILPKNDTNTTNATTNITSDLNDTITNITNDIENTIDNWTNATNDLIVTYEDGW